MSVSVGRSAPVRAALAVVVALSLGACSEDTPEPVLDADAPLEPTGEPVTLARGGEDDPPWQLTAQQSSAGVCLEVRSDGDDPTVGCGFEVPERHDIASFVHEAGDGLLVVAGPVTDEAEVVSLEVEDSASVEVRPVGQDAGLGTSFFAVSVPASDVPRTVAAIAPDGVVLESRPLPPSPARRE